MNDTHSSRSITNKIKKRKLDEYNDNIDNEPYRKKRKLNNKNTPHTLTTLIRKHKLLQKQNNSLMNQNNSLTNKSLQYKQGLNVYKNEVNKWKTKYTQLYSQLSIFINNYNPDNFFAIDDYSNTNNNTIPSN
eukprot:335633_1